MSKNFEKEYKESIGRAKKILGDCDKPIDTNIKEAIEAIFPILKKDKPVISREVIREGVAHFGITQYQIDNWLKKHFDIIDQGPCMEMKLNEQEKVNCGAGLEFHKDDWVVKDNVIAQILDVQDQYYIGLDTEGNDFTVSRFLSHNKIHLWTIEDAMDGDVLANDHHILILKELVYDWSSNGTSYSVKAYCGIKPNGNFEIGKDNWSFCGTLHIHPATKEQRDTLFAEMKESGYEFDFGKKELKEIDTYCQENCKGFQETGRCFADGDCKAKKEAEHKQTSVKWSEEDETYLDLINTAVKLYYTDDKGKENPWRNELLRWLKSLKQRIGG